MQRAVVWSMVIAAALAAPRAVDAAVDYARRLGAKTAALTGLIPAIPDFGRALQPCRGLTITTGAGVGKPADLLIAEAKRLEATVIAVGNRRMQGAGRLLGSVANSIAHHAPCDVYIVKTT